MINQDTFKTIKDRAVKLGMGERFKAFEERVQREIDADPRWSGQPTEKRRLAGSFMVMGYAYGISQYQDQIESMGGQNGDATPA